MGQGRENARQFLKENVDIRNEIESRLRKGLGLPAVEFPATPSSARAEAVAAVRGEKASVLPMPEKKKA